MGGNVAGSPSVFVCALTDSDATVSSKAKVFFIVFNHINPWPSGVYNHTTCNHAPCNSLSQAGSLVPFLGAARFRKFICKSTQKTSVFIILHPHLG